MPTGFPDYYGGLTLPVTVPEGGTGQTTINAGAVLIGNATGSMVVSNVGTANQVLQVPGGGGNPQFQSLTISAGAISGIIPIANGGTGTATPALVAGTAISIAGSWPAQTINNTSAYASLADPLPVAHGGTGTATPALVAGAGISLSGAWPNITIANSDDAYFSSAILAIAHGGTGTATPALVAGNGISIAGTWPAQTVAVSGTISGALTVTGALFVGNVSGGSSTGGDLTVRRSSTQGAVFFGDNAANFLFYNGTVFDLHGGGLTIDSGSLVLPNPLAVAYGGTGATTLAAANITNIVARVDLTGQTAAIASTTIITPTAAGMYRVTAEIFVTSTSETTGSLSLGVAWIQNTDNPNLAVINLGGLPVATQAYSGSVSVYVDANTAIRYDVTIPTGGSINYDVHIRVEQI